MGNEIRLTWLDERRNEIDTVEVVPGKTRVAIPLDAMSVVVEEADTGPENHCPDPLSHVEVR
jgi:hypothetical protein